MFNNYKEIVTKTIIGKGKKVFKNDYEIVVDKDINNVLGCWVINHNLRGKKDNDYIKINGSYDINIWYSYDNNTKTDVVSRKMFYEEKVKVKVRENTELNDEKLIKIKFNGEIDTPIVANIICDCNVIVSIIYADSKVVEGRVYGQIIFKMPKDEREVKKVERYLQLKNVSFEEVYIDEYQQHFSNDI